ncbi:LptF/LptG family permease [Devosia sp. A16]|uniref:LptF/LptG family permease n=1 Tax=Devosia sp. A16 TaxID=1736675 RepID=UPI0006D8126A|nr:LptF/LptG family permease [Devosia sp. A16]
MNRIDWIVVRRLGSNVGLTLAVLFGIVLLVEALNTTRFAALSATGGQALALAAVVLSAARWLIDTLPLTFLVGTVAGLLNLQATREITVIKASGQSVWRVMIAPLAITLLGGVVITLVVDTAVIQFNRTLSPSGTSSGEVGRTGALWLDERQGDLHYILEAGYVNASGTALGDIHVFLMDAPRDRIEAPTAELVGGEWVMAQATRFRSNEMPEAITDFRLPTVRTPGDMRARTASVKDMTVWELAASLAARLSDSRERAETETRFLRLLALPLTLCGSLVIAFAFTAGYRRTNKYGGAVLYGIVLGVLVYVVTEMAGRAGGAGVMHPVIAVAGPAVVAIVIGVTVLLNREDGRT